MNRLHISNNHTEAATRGVLYKKVFLKISQKSQENTCATVSFFNKVGGLRPATLLKKRAWYWCFSVNFVKFLFFNILRLFDVLANFPSMRAIITYKHGIYQLPHELPNDLGS